MDLQSPSSMRDSQHSERVSLDAGVSVKETVSRARDSCNPGIFSEPPSQRRRARGAAEACLRVTRAADVFLSPRIWTLRGQQANRKQRVASGWVAAICHLMRALRPLHLPSPGRAVLRRVRFSHTAI